MRTKIGKRIGPVPIALVAVLALAAFISAGLWLVPNSAHAQSAIRTGVAIDDVVVDVGEEMVITAEDVKLAFKTVLTADGSVEYRIESDQNDADTDTGIETGDASGQISITPGTGEITISSEVATPTRADLADNTATITVTAVVLVSGDEVATAEVDFDVTIVQNPIENMGDPYVNPADGNPDVDDPQPFPAGDCVVGTDGMALSTRDDVGDTPMAIALESPTNLLVSGGDCTTSGNSVEVSFTNTKSSGNAPNTVGVSTTHVIYVTGGSKFRNVMPRLAKVGLNEHILLVPAPVFNDQAGEATIEVPRSMADDDGLVYLIGYADEASSANQLKKTTTFRQDAAFVVKVRFLNVPVAGDDKSRLGLVDAETPPGAISEVPGSEEEANVMVTVTDDNGQPLPGARVTFTIEDAPDSVVFKETTEKRYRTAVDNNGTKVVTLEGIPEDDPFKYNLKAALDDGPTLEKNIIRRGDPEMATLSTYAICDPGECKAEDLVLAPGVSFFVVAKAMDTAGNDVSKDNFDDIEGETDADKDVLTAITGNAETEIWWNSLDCAAMVKAAGDMRKANADNPFCNIYEGLVDEGLVDDPKTVVDGLDVPDYFAAFEVDGEAEIGMYSIEATTDNDKTATASITVSGKAMGIEVSCEPEVIPADTGLTLCTVMVTDANGNPASNLDTDSAGDITSTASVAVRSREVKLIGDDGSGRVVLDKNGMGSFSIQLREDAPEGISVTVTVSAMIGTASLQHSIVVVYGDAGGTPTVPGGELGTPMGVGTGLNLGGALNVYWTKAANATGYTVIAINTDLRKITTDFVAVPTNRDVDNWTIAGLTPGEEYNIFVAATASGGKFKLSDPIPVTAE